MQHRPRVGEEQQRDGRGDNRVDQQHHVLLGPAVGQPAHEQTPGDAADQDEREHARHLALPVPLVEREVQLEVLHRPADGADGAHAADEQQIERGRSQQLPHVERLCGIGLRHRRGVALGRVTYEPRQRPRAEQHEQTERLQCPLPAELRREPVRQQGHHGSTDADAEIGEAHRLAARRREPAREQHLARQRPTEHVPEGVEQVEDVEARERRDGTESDERAAGHEDAHQQQSSGPVPVDQPSRQVAEQRTDHQLAVRVARRDLLPRPPELGDEEVVEEGQAVERDADDGEERREGGGGGERLAAAGRGHARALNAFSRAWSGWAVYSGSRG